MNQADSSSGQLKVKACVKELDADHEGRIPVMVSIKAPLPGMAAERPPVDLVLVLHVQKGRPAPVKWRTLLMEAVEVAIGKLGDNDRLAVLADSTTRSAEKTTRKSEEELNKALYAKYGKEVKLMQVSDENCRRVQVSAVNKAIRSDTLLVTALELANSMLHNREYEDKENRAAYVIVISNSNKQDIGSLLAWRFLSIHAFGFRDARNARTMYAIASSRECTYSLLDDEGGRITQAFAACIDRITSAGAAMPIEVKLKCERKVVLDAIDAPRISYFISYEKNAATIWTSAWMHTKFIIYLLKAQGEEKLNSMDLLKFFTVRVKYGHITVHAPESSNKLDSKVVPRSDKLQGEVMPPSDMLDGKVVPESHKLHGKVMAESDNLDSKMMMESSKPDGKVVMESDKPDGKAMAESDKLDGKVEPESNNLDRKVVEESNKPDRKVVKELDKLDGKVVAELDKPDGKVVAETDKLDGEVVLESDKPYEKVVIESDKRDRKVVTESDKTDRKVVMESDKTDGKVVMETDEPDGKAMSESDTLDGKVEPESNNLDRKVVEESNKPDGKVVKESDKLDGKVVAESDKPDGKVVAETDKLDSKVVMESDKPDEKVVMESDKTDRMVVAESDKLDGKVVMESDEPDEKVVMETKKPDGKAMPESDKLDGKVEPESNNLDRKVVEESNKPYGKVVKESDKLDGKVVAESDKPDGKVVAETDKLDSKVVIESDKPDEKVVMEYEKTDRKVVAESDKLDGKVVMESDEPDGKVVMETKKPDGKAMPESDKLDGKVEPESNNLDRKVVEESNKPDGKVVKESDKLDGKVVAETDKLDGKVVMESDKPDEKVVMESDRTDRKVVAESDKLDGKVVMESDEPDGKVVMETKKPDGKAMPESDKLDGKVEPESNNLDRKVVEESNKPDGKVVKESDKLDGKVVAETDKLDGKVVMESDKPDEKVVMESDKTDRKVVAEPDKLDGKVVMESDEPDGKVVMETKKPDGKAMPESDKLDGKVEPESNSLDRKVVEASNKPDGTVVKESHKLDGNVVAETDKLDGKVVAQTDKLDEKVVMESDKPDEKLVMESGKTDMKVVAESGKLDGKVVMESDEPDGKVVMETKKPDGKAMAESDKIDGKVEPESNYLDRKVVEESKKLDRKVLAESNKLDGKVEPESDKLEGKVVTESEKPMKSDKLDGKVVAESDKLDGDVVPESDELDTKVVMGSSKLDGAVVAKSYKLSLTVKTIEHDGKVDLLWKGKEGYNEMAGEMVRIEAVKIVADITREDRSHLHLVNLAEELHERWTKLQNTDCGKVAGEARLISMLADEMQEMQKRLHYNYFWLEYMLSWQSYQWWQLPLPPLFMDKRDTEVDPPLQLTIFPKERATPWANEYTVPRQLKVVVRVAAPPGLKRCPVDLIAILDASYGAEEKTQKRLRLLVKATELVMTKLDHKDRLAIMHVQSPVTQPTAGTSLIAMSEQGRNEISAMLKSLLVSKPPPAIGNEKVPQTSHWREQLNKARKLVRELLSIASVNTSIRTQTSPERQSSTAAVAQSVGGSSNLWKALEGAKEILVDRPPAEKEQRAGFIIVISDSNDDSIIHETPRRTETDFDYIVHAVSFHDSGPRNTRAMNHIAHCSNGIYAVLDDGQDQITDAFTACINTITSIVAVSTVVTIRCNHNSIVVLNNIQSAGQVFHSVDHDRKSVSISAGTFYAGTVRNFIAIVDNVGWYEYGMFYKFYTVDVTWRHPLSRKEDRLHGEVYVRDGSEVLKEVESRLIVANTVTVITDPYFLDKNLVADGEAVEKDKQVIERQSMDKLSRLFHECSREARDAGEALLANEMEKLKDNLERERVKMHENQSIGKGIDHTFIEELLAEPLSYMLSWLSRNF